MSKNIAIIATHGFEESELKSPKEHLEQHGWKVDIISPEAGTIKAWAEKDWGQEYEVNKTFNEASASDYDALVVPGGVLNPDKLRTDENALHFVRSCYDQPNPVGAICHGPQVLSDAQGVEGRRRSSVRNISKDAKNAYAQWQDEEVVVDAGLVT